jgi:hypothetical protein
MIGLGYLGPPNNLRGWAYSIGEVVASHHNLEVARAIRYVSMMDAVVSTYQYNKSITKVLMVPGVSSINLMILRTF